MMIEVNEFGNVSLESVQMLNATATGLVYYDNENVMHGLRKNNGAIKVNPNIKSYHIICSNGNL